MNAEWSMLSLLYIYQEINEFTTESLFFKLQEEFNFGQKFGKLETIYA